MTGLLHASVARARPESLASAMSHALGGSSSRVRPRFCLAVARAASRRETLPQLVYASAAAVELIHCASLVHDDMPCFDDAATRRGRPSVHRQFGEATALLVGDALIIESFRVLAACEAPATAFAILARAAGGTGGLVSGQAMELGEASVDVEAYHRAKTGGLFEAAAALGAEAVGADPRPYELLGRRIGALYQLADDVADAYGDPQILGKPVGRDAALGRPSAAGEPGNREDAARSLEDMAAELRRTVAADARELQGFVDAVIGRIVERAFA